MEIRNRLKEIKEQEMKKVMIFMKQKSLLKN